MNVSTTTRVAIIAVPIALIALWVLAFAVDKAAAEGEVARGVSAAGVDLSGLSEDDALRELRTYERTLRTTPAPFLVANNRLNLIPVDIALKIDEEAIVTEAMVQRRTEGMFSQFFGWIGSFNDPIVLDIPVTYDEELLEDVFDEWEQLVIDSPAYSGAVIINEGRALPDYPRPGEGIDRSPARTLVGDSVIKPERDMITLPTRAIEPDLTEDDINVAVEEANRLIGNDIILRSADPERDVVFTAEQLLNAFTTEVQSNSATQIVQGYDRDEIAAIVLDLKEELEKDPVNAQFLFNDETERVSIVPGENAQVIDIDLVMDALYAAAQVPSRSGDFPYAEGSAPRFTTEAAQAMMPIRQVSTFTTRHDAGGRGTRVQNIHQIADDVDGVVVWPGDTFSINEHVGPRTTAKGYVPAGTLVNGRLVDTVGGGVSQFATTFYNAVFYGGYEDVEHKPHSRYFSRYPEVNEATMGYPWPDLKFRNNTDSIVIIKTSYTNRSITVTFYGNNGGKDCKRTLGERRDEKVGGTEYRGNPDLNPGQEVKVESKTRGWTNSVTRTCTIEGEEPDVERWTWRYSALPEIIERHPCEVPGSSVACPSPVPNVVGQTFGGATATLAEAGFLIANNGSEETSDPDKDGLVASQSPGSGKFLGQGSTVKVIVFTYVPPPDDGGGGGGDGEGDGGDGG